MKEVDEIIESFISANEPGCVISIIKDKKIIYKNSYGLANLETNTPITIDTHFHVASLSKQFTAIGLKILEERKIINFNDPANKYLPQDLQIDERITIEDLIYHKSGLRDQWELIELAGFKLTDSITQEDIYRIINNQKELNFNPGEEFQYCSSGYTILSKIIVLP